MEDSKAVDLITGIRLPFLVDRLRTTREVTLTKASEQFRILAVDLRIDEELANTCARVAALIMSAERELEAALTLLKDDDDD
jgi:hypothetical protein|tara:strand:- start:14 stop:259 length:246 start_codon:yes stop_codon:yes gene_type:complete